MDQFSFFSEYFWIPRIENNCRYWECPNCSKRVDGQPLHWAQFNYYNYCPYCGIRLFTDFKYISSCIDERGCYREGDV